MVVDGAAAARLAEVRTRRYLDPFLSRERAVAEAARLLDVSVATMWHHAQALVRVGLLREVRRAPRAGRAIRYYRAVAADFELPLRALPFETLEELVDRSDAVPGRALRDGLVDAAVRRGFDADELVLRYRLLDNGLSDVSPGLRGGRPLPMSTEAVWSSWTTLLLDVHEATELRAELEALWRRWALRAPAPGVDTAPHTLRLALAPVASAR